MFSPRSGELNSYLLYPDHFDQDNAHGKSTPLGQVNLGKSSPLAPPVGGGRTRRKSDSLDYGGRPWFGVSTARNRENEMLTAPPEGVIDEDDDTGEPKGAEGVSECQSHPIGSDYCVLLI